MLGWVGQALVSEASLSEPIRTIVPRAWSGPLSLHAPRLRLTRHPSCQRWLHHLRHQTIFQKRQIWCPSPSAPHTSFGPVAGSCAWLQQPCGSHPRWGGWKLVARVESQEVTRLIGFGATKLQGPCQHGKVDASTGGGFFAGKLCCYIGISAWPRCNGFAT